MLSFKWTISLLSALIFSSSAYAQGIFTSSGDIGKVLLKGSVNYDTDNQTYMVEGSGANMWSDEDAFRFVWKRMHGNFILRTEAKFVGTGIDPHRKLGWIIRSSLDPGAPYIDVAVHGDGLTAMQFRRSMNGQTAEVRSSLSSPEVIQLARNGHTYTMSVANSADTLVSDALSDLDIGDTVYVGLFVCAHNDTVLEKAVFHNTRIIVPAQNDFVPYRNFIGSNLEIVDVFSGHRKIVYREEKALQAPNWTNDGKALIYNLEGRLYRFDLGRKIPERIETDFATANNNDHVLSFDGQMIGISHHPETNNFESIIYILPVEGGVPEQVTDTGPSYLHGWSPDGRHLTYTAKRDGDFDVYKISRYGGKELQLTNSPGLDDGPEYTPDGKYIYFNSVRSGKMQIWRMKPDGSEQKQITNDNLNNWFPHISPDGKWIVFLSFMQDVAPDDHPFYRQVYIRMMPLEGGNPRIIAYVYGGQGTINVPSWSPDSRRVAFVSNSN